MFTLNEVLNIFVLQTLQLVPEELLNWKAVRAKLTRRDAAQWAVLARPQSRVDYHEKMQFKCLKRYKAATKMSSAGESRAMVKGLKIDRKREV